MVLEYFNRKKGKQPVTTATATTTAVEAKSPVLKEEDEAFLRKITAEEQPDLTKALVILDKSEADGIQGADQVPLPTSPPAVEEPKEVSGKKAATGKRNYWQYIQSKVQVPQFANFKDHNKHQTGANLQDVANAVKSGDSLAPPTVVVSPEEAEKEEKDLSSILDQLNLSAINNRAFSFSKESQRLMDDFTQVLKDLVNGVPTAYDDLEKLLTNSESQLQGMFDGLPPFLQKLVKTLPAKVTASIAPGLLAAASEKPGADGLAAASSSADKKSKGRIPSLKRLVAQQGAVTSMLNSILNFLKLRFPLAFGTNVLLSLALFILLFVFWYCHKRGRETRLEKEKLAADAEHSDGSVSASDVDDSVVLEKPDPEAARVEAILKKPTT